jgi:PAS domain S-box-containing protein
VADYAIYCLDATGEIVSWNLGAERIKGYAAREILGRHFSVFFTREDRTAGLPVRMLGEAARTGRCEVEGWRIRQDGSRFFAQATLSAIRDNDGRLSGYVKVTRDITERRAAQQALADSEHQLRLLIGSVVDYALIMLDANGIVASWNTGAERIKGYAAEEIIGHHFSRFYTEADRAAGLPAKALSHAAEHGAFSSEGWRRRKDGVLFWARVSMDAIHDEQGRLVGFAKIARDVTEQRDAALELDRAREQLAQSQKMEALGQLTGGVAHDFNNLLMIIGGHAQLLKKTMTDDARGAAAIGAIETAVRRGTSLTRQLLSFAGRQQLQRSVVELNARITAFRQMIEGTLGARVRLAADLPEGLWPVDADVSELELSLVNICVNARDAMPEGGLLSISAENVAFATPDLETGLAGDYVALSLSDTGVGIPADILPRVFDPFFTTKEADKGTGLGLSQVYGFARRVGGAATVRSRMGEGATVTLFLPRAGTSARQSEAAPTERSALSGRILVVEDNPEVAKVSAALLAELGHRPVVTNSPEAALAALERDPDFDLVFSDIVMAGPIDGAALARLIRERLPALPVLLTSGYGRAAEAVSDEFAILRKPYQITELGRAVAKFLVEARSPADATKLVRLSEARQARAARQSSEGS